MKYSLSYLSETVLFSLSVTTFLESPIRQT